MQRLALPGHQTRLHRFHRVDIVINNAGIAIKARKTQVFIVTDAKVMQLIKRFWPKAALTISRKLSKKNQEQLVSGHVRRS